MSEYRARPVALRRVVVSVVSSVVLAGAAGIAGPAAVAAATRADSTPYENFIYMSCDSSPCQQQIYRVPSNRRLKVFALSCAAEVRDAAAVSRIGVRRRLAGGGEEIVDLTSHRVGVQGDTQYFAVPSGRATVVDAGDTVNAFVDAEGKVDTFYCFLAGDLTPIR